MTTMKKISTLIMVLMASMAIQAQVVLNSTNFPDENFRRCLQGEYYRATWEWINEGETIPAEFIKNFKTLELFSALGIESLQGIEFFTELEVLNTLSEPLASLDVSKNTKLKELYCYSAHKKLTSLDVSKNTALEILDCHLSELTSLDLSKNTALKTLDCSWNKLTSLDLTNCTALTRVDAYNNPLSSLKLPNSTALTYLSCQYNNLSSLDVSSCPELTYLRCADGPVTSLNVTNCTKLETLDCTYCNLSSLDLTKCTALEGVYLSSNQLTTLDLSGCTSKLNRIEIFRNNFSGAGMDQLVNSLPYTDGLSSLDGRGELLLFDKRSGVTENNVITAEQLAIAKSKNWDVQYLDDEGNELDYELGIDGVKVDGEVSDRYYTLDGHLLQETPIKPGLYINSGRKVIVK